MIWDQFDIAWLAGIIEGEGCIDSQTLNGNQARVRVSMVDEDIIRRLESLTGIGHVRKSSAKPRSEHHKQAWEWYVNDRKSVARLLLAIYPIMGKRRQASIAVALEQLPWPPQRRRKGELWKI